MSASATPPDFSPPASPKRSFASLEDEEFDEPRGKRSCCFVADPFLEEDVVMVDAAPPSPVLQRRVKLQRETVVKTRVSRQTKLAKLVAKRLRQWMILDQDVVMIDLTDDAFAGPSKRRMSDDDFVPSPKRYRTCKQHTGCRYKHKPRRRKVRKETYAKRSYSSRLRRDQAFLEELIAEAERMHAARESRSISCNFHALALFQMPRRPLRTMILYLWKRKSGGCVN